MPSRDYYEHIWENVREHAIPGDAELRERFLLDRLQAERAHHERTAGARVLRVLDVGCGAGYFTAAVARLGLEVVGIDVAAEALRRAGAEHPGVELRLVDSGAPLPFEDSSFDVIWVGDTLEHVHDTEAFLSELRRVLRSGGLLLLTTPDHGPLLMLWLALRPSRLQERFDPRADHLRFYTRSSLLDLLDDFGFEDIVVRRAGGLPGACRQLLASARRKRF